MKRALKSLAALIVLAIIGYGAVQTYRKVQERKQLARGVAGSQEPPTVAVQPVQTATLINTTSVTGEIEPLAEVEVIPKVTGKLERLRLPSGQLIEKGTVVKKGEVIAVIERGALEAAVKAAQAALLRAKIQAKPEVVEGQIRQAHAAARAAKAQLADLEKTLRDLANDKDRATSLSREGVISAQMRDKAVTAHEAALEKAKALRADVDRAEATVVLAEAQTRESAEAAVAGADAALQQAQVALDEATIAAPISGVVCMKHVDEGDMVGPMTPLVQIMDVDTVKVTGGISERHFSALVPGKTKARVRVDAYPGEEFEGTVHQVSPSIDRLTRTVGVEIRIPNPTGRLKPGMFARLDLILQRRENVAVVPDSALLRAGEETFVYVVNNSVAHRGVLKLGLAEGPRHEVLEGVKPGELIVVKGQHMLKDGDSVKVVEEGKS
jgi:multidrug efflux pump subunit AcrA (membrane-fusion protein)